MTIRRGRLGTGRLGAADYAPGLLGTWTFRHLDFYVPRLLGARGKKNFFSKNNFFLQKKFFFQEKKFFSKKQVFFQKKVNFSTKKFFF